MDAIVVDTYSYYIIVIYYSYIIFHSDADTGQNGLITYSILEYPGGNSDWFTVHNASGMIKTARETITCISGSPPK